MARASPKSPKNQPLITHTVASTVETRSRILIRRAPVRPALSKRPRYCTHGRSRAPAGLLAIILMSIMRLLISMLAPSTSRMKSVVTTLAPGLATAAMFLRMATQRASSQSCRMNFM